MLAALLPAHPLLTTDSLAKTFLAIKSQNKYGVFLL